MATTFFQKANPATRKSAVEVITVLSVNFRDDEDKEDFVKELHRNLLDVLICLGLGMCIGPGVVMVWV